MTKTQKFLYNFVGRYQLFVISVVVRKRLKRSIRDIYKALLKRDKKTIEDVKNVFKESRTLRLLASSGFVMLDAFVNNLLIGFIVGLMVDVNKNTNFVEKVKEFRKKKINEIDNEFLKRFLYVATAEVTPFAASNIKLFMFQLMLSYSVAGITEEGSKFLANMFGFDKEYLTILNINEFTEYVVSGYIGAKFEEFKAKDLLDRLKSNNDFDEELVEDLKKHLEKFAQAGFGLKELGVDLNNVDKHTLNKKAKIMLKRYLHLSKKGTLTKLNITSRLFAVLLHIFLNYLHKKNKTLTAILTHASFNAVFSLVHLTIVGAYIEYKIESVV